MKCIIKNPDSDMNGNTAENIFIASNENGAYLGHGYVYTHVYHEIALEHPYNLFIDINVNEGVENCNDVKDALFERVMQRAVELRKEYPDLKARIYGGCFSGESEKIGFFISKGFIHDDGTYLYERNLSIGIPEIVLPENIRIRENHMENEEERNRYIEIHNNIFSKKISNDNLYELMKEKLWTNFSAYVGENVVGNIMVFGKVEEHNGERIGFIENLYVLSDWQGHKIARSLIITALKYFQSHGMKKSQLDVWGRNKRAVQLYKSLGYVFVGEKEAYPGINL